MLREITLSSPKKKSYTLVALFASRGQFFVEFPIGWTSVSPRIRVLRAIRPRPRISNPSSAIMKVDILLLACVALGVSIPGSFART